MVTAINFLYSATLPSSEWVWPIPCPPLPGEDERAANNASSSSSSSLPRSSRRRASSSPLLSLMTLPVVGVATEVEVGGVWVWPASGGCGLGTS